MLYYFYHVHVVEAHLIVDTYTTTTTPCRMRDAVIIRIRAIGIAIAWHPTVAVD